MNERLTNLDDMLDASAKLFEAVEALRMSVYRARGLEESGEKFCFAYGWANKVHSCLDIEKRLSL